MDKLQKPTLPEPDRSTVRLTGCSVGSESWVWCTSLSCFRSVNADFMQNRKNNPCCSSQLGQSAFFHHELTHDKHWLTVFCSDSHVGSSVLLRDRFYSNWCFYGSWSLGSWPCHHGDVLWRMMGLIHSWNSSAVQREAAVQVCLQPENRLNSTVLLLLTWGTWQQSATSLQWSWRRTSAGYHVELQQVDKSWKITNIIHNLMGSKSSFKHGSHSWMQQPHIYLILN